MKVIHFQKLFSQIPHLRNQFNFLQELTGASYFEASLDAIPDYIKSDKNTTSNFTYSLVNRYYSIKEKAEPTPVLFSSEESLTQDDLAIFIANAAHNDGNIFVDNEKIENLFPEIALNKHRNNTINWRSLLDSVNVKDEENIKEKTSPLQILSDAKIYLDMTPEEKILYLGENSAALASEVFILLANNGKIHENTKTLIEDLIDYPHLSVNTLSILVESFPTSSRNPNAKEFTAKISAKIKQSIFQSPEFLVRFWHHLDEKATVPNHLWNQSTLRKLGMINFNNEKTSKLWIDSSWLKDINNLIMLNQTDRDERSYLMNVFFSQEVFEHYVKKGGDDFASFIKINSFHNISNATMQYDKKLFNNPIVFQKIFTVEPIKLKKIMEEDEYHKNIVHILVKDDPNNYINTDRESWAKFKEPMSEVIEKQSIEIIEKWLPFIFKTSFNASRFNILDKIDFDKHKKEIYQDFCNQYNDYFSAQYLKFLESKDKNASSEIIAQKPLMYSKSLFIKYRHDKDKIMLFLKSIDYQTANTEAIKLIPSIMFNDTDIAIKSIDIFKDKMITHLPKEHFKNLDFILPMLNSINKLNPKEQNKFIQFLPTEIQNVLIDVAPGTNKRDFLDSYLKFLYIKKEQEKISTDNNIQTNFKI